MNVLLINEVFGTTSTGKICAEIAEKYESEGHTVKVAFGRWPEVPEKYRRFSHYFGSDLQVKIHGGLTRVLDAQGLGSWIATKKLIKWMTEYDPGLLWIHNLHGYYINYPLLFKWIKSRPQMKVQWTLHDCWAFTGHCVYFSMCKCERWVNGCHSCPQKKEYPSSLFYDGARRNYRIKKENFSGVSNMKLVVPSQWMEELVKRSFLKEYVVEVSYNKVDSSVFKPTKNDFKMKQGIESKKMILGVSNAWKEPRKGLKDFLELADLLDEKYVIVLVGVTEDLMKKIPKKIISLPKTKDLIELAGLYTAADIYVNPSYEETFGMTTLEAILCGTEVIVYKDTACEEVVSKYGGISVKQGAEHIYNAIIEKFSEDKK